METAAMNNSEACSNQAKQDTTNHLQTINEKKIKSLYDELAEKEQALILAAQFGNNLIEEKENLERQMESNRQEQLCHIEALEQESYELKREIQSMRNEYEAKIYELTEDLNLLNKKLIENNHNHNSQKHDQNEQFYLIQELSEKNKQLTEEIKINEQKFATESESKVQLEMKLRDNEQAQGESAKLLGDFQKEISKLIKKQQELEFALMQTCNERDKQTKLIEELTKKYLFVENEKNEMEHLVFQHENEIFSLRRVNQDLVYKFENIELHANALNRKRRSTLTNANINNSTGSLSQFEVNDHNENRFFEKQSAFKAHHNSSPFRQIENSNFYHRRSELENDTDLNVFKMNEIEEDDDCENHEIEEADESVDMYTKSAYENESSDCFAGAINWQQEAIAQKIHDENDSNDHTNESQDSNQNDHSNYVLTANQEDSQSPFGRIMEDDSSQSLSN